MERSDQLYSLDICISRSISCSLFRLTRISRIKSLSEIAAPSFDQLNSGEEYKEVLPVHSIGFLNFTLFEDQPEFFATYELRNKKTGHLYSSKFSIHVLDLTRIDLATAEDQNYEIDRWAKLFKAVLVLRVLSEDEVILHPFQLAVFDFQRLYYPVQ